MQKEIRNKKEIYNKVNDVFDSMLNNLTTILESYQFANDHKSFEDQNNLAIYTSTEKMVN